MQMRLYNFFLGLLLPCCTLAEQISFATIRRDVIESRLQLADRSNEKRKESVWQLFQQSGCTGESLTEQPVKKKGLPNVICKLPGKSLDTIIVGAHFDALTLGVVDNWSGASLLPALYQSLSTQVRQHTFLFIAFTDEEKGLIGSRHYVKSLSKEDRLLTKAMINMDSLGLSPTNVWASRSDKQLVNYLLAAATHLNLPMTGVNIEQVGSTDSESFASAKIPRISISSVTQDTLPILHSPKDTLEAISKEHYYDTYRLMVVYLALLDVKLANP